MILIEDLENLISEIGSDVKHLNSKVSIFSFNDPVENDIVQFKNGKMTNVEAQSITDGGNF